MTIYEKRRQIDVGEQFSKGRAYSNIDFFMGMIAIFGLLIIGTRHFDTWGRVNIMEGFMALAGIIGLNYIKNRDFQIMKFKSFIWNTLPRMTVMLVGVIFIQLISRVPFTIDNIELALSIVFAAVAEELFFRGVLISVFIEMDEATNPFDEKKIVKNFIFGRTNLNIRIFSIVGIFLSSLFFAFIHTNYYDDPRMLIVVFVGGLIFGFGYFIWEDMTANILAHFILNCIAVGQSGLLVNLSGNYNNPLFISVFIVIVISSLGLLIYLNKRKKKNNKKGGY